MKENILWIDDDANAASAKRTFPLRPEPPIDAATMKYMTTLFHPLAFLAIFKFIQANHTFVIIVILTSLSFPVITENHCLNLYNLPLSEHRQSIFDRPSVEFWFIISGFEVESEGEEVDYNGKTYGCQKLIVIKNGFEPVRWHWRSGNIRRGWHDIFLLEDKRVHQRIRRGSLWILFIRVLFLKKLIPSKKSLII